VPRFGARTFREALQSLRVLHYALWCEGEYHCGLGRIDQYLLPYFEADRAAGRLDDAGALELAKADEKVAAALEGKTIIKELYVKGRLVNIVAK
ncbi:MAG: hypothetical protein J6Y62_09545, partial [Clostridia bacterium]|nr:hypothetical protein [Clostridia bacterium]